MLYSQKKSVKCYEFDYFDIVGRHKPLNLPKKSVHIIRHHTQWNIGHHTEWNIG